MSLYVGVLDRLACSRSLQCLKLNEAGAKVENMLLDSVLMSSSDQGAKRILYWGIIHVRAIRKIYRPEMLTAWSSGSSIAEWHPFSSVGIVVPKLTAPKFYLPPLPLSPSRSEDEMETDHDPTPYYYSQHWDLRATPRPRMYSSRCCCSHCLSQKLKVQPARRGRAEVCLW